MINIETIALPSKVVEDWDFNFIGGSALTITVDAELGDSYTLSLDSPMIHFYIAERKSPMDNETVIGAEDVFIPTSNILCMRKHLRTVEAVSAEDQEEWKEVLQ